MKKKQIVYILRSGMGHKLILKMKLTFIILIFCLTQVSATVYSQATKFTFNLQAKQVVDVLNEIENKSDFRFFYQREQVDVTRKVDLNVNEISIEAILDELFKDQGISYKVMQNNLIVITPKGENSTSFNQQNKSVSGKVTDTSGGALPGVSVVVKGTTNGTITDANGNYSVSNIPANAILQFSFVGMKTQEAVVGNNQTINVTLDEENIGIEEVVAVGYGTQKKVNLTGSISSVASDELENRPITQTSQALSGLVSGVSVSQASGRPGNDAASITIRGMGTFSGAGNNPLVLVDGLASDMNQVDPNNIKSISVLKDAASCAIYGTRAANGVILIETKRGQQGKLQVSYDNYIGWQKVSALPEFVDAGEYATLKNEAAINMNQAKPYSDAQIAKYKDGSDPDNYPNVPHLKNLLNSGSGFQTSHNLSFLGGDEKNSFRFSMGYLDQDGIVAKNNYKKYNFSLNLDSKIKENLRLKVDLSGNSRNTIEPRHGEGDMMHMINYTGREPAIFAGLKSDGTYGYQDNYGYEAWLNSNSFNSSVQKYFMGGAELSWEIIKGLTLSGKAGYNYNNYTNNSFVASVIFDKFKTLGPNNLSVNSGDNSLLTLQSLIQYVKKIDNHNFSALAGFSQESFRQDWITASRDKFPNNSLFELNAGAKTNMQAYGSASEWAIRSYFGRLNYSFNEKYLFEANARYDGTSRFPSKGRWGLFPSFSAGWRLSEESFIKDNLQWINNMKVRASWGELGNQNIGEYPYQSMLALGQDYPLGGSLSSGARVNTLANTDITWETTKVTDIGFDLSIFKNKLSMVLDYFDKTTSNILYNISVAQILGMSPSAVNAGEVKNTGFEFQMNYQTSIKDVKIGIIPNFSYINNRVTKLATVEKDIAKGLFIGQPLGSIYGYVVDGLFKDAADVSSYPSQPYAAEPGFVRYKDLSGPNGVPDGKVDATYDRKVIGTTVPKYSYGATITLDYKGFDFSVLLSGLGGFNKQMGSYQAFAFMNGGNIQKWQADGRWTTANPDPNAKYVKLTSLNLGSGTAMTSTYWNTNASFLRLKNLQLGYSLPASLIQKLKISKARIFFSGQNLFVLSHFYKGWDPEMYQNTSDFAPYYPLTAVYTFGVNVKF
jgi:TonB-linked SusC/RagA family outer membrane protein